MAGALTGPTSCCERLHKQNPEALAADIRAIADRASSHIKRPYLDHADYLYDEHGLPK